MSVSLDLFLFSSDYLIEEDVSIRGADCLKTHLNRLEG